MKKTYKELLREAQEINDRINAESDAQKREQLTKEFADKMREAQLAKENAEAERMEREQAAAQPKKTSGQMLRELLAGQRNGTQEREITLASQIKNSGAIELTIKDIVPNLEEGTGLPSALTVVGGVTGNVLYPTDATDMEMEEVGEIADNWSDSAVDFDKVQVTPHRVVLSTDISNSAIDNAAFNLQGHVQGKFAKAWRKYLANKVYSQAAFSGNKGGFSGLASSSGTVNITAKSAFGDILKAVASFVDKGFDPNSLCLTVDAPTEALLKMCPKQNGVAGYCIENGKLCGYEYTVSHRINTVLGGDAKTDSGNTDNTKLYKTTKSYLGIGFYDYLKIQQHGVARLSMDATSKAMAKKNCTNITLNTEVSFTDLSNHIYDEDGKAVKAFAIYEIA